ncbi:NAD-dependent epimerase/dehydratase family protein [Sphingobium sp. AR-3-1]|uniref:NAD-dependent epimerase/dehydratase family protein n=1 Tax=Sphingobium psychrophilum TaxID=2728834 RepID=A0A7X9WZX8_9SPHN|nr:NAD-dependent epimerase/dehydratase family protein [Sphingobium psychrophilum]NML13011.1 NAD-dependent epimerase/dehydratase family protein [Sphingobium psychrophilum]
MARILVTGATGFVGSCVYGILQQDGHELKGTTKSRPGGHIVFCNIENASEVGALIGEFRPEIVIHCAAISSVTSSESYEYYLSNTIGTENILKSLSSTGGKTRFIFISTAGVYGNQDTDSLSENLCPKPVHHYGMSKFCCERLIHNYRDVIDYTIIRPFNIIGEGQSADFIVPKLSHAFAAREPVLRLGNLDVYRDYLDIREACEIIRHITFNQEAVGETYNLCSGNPVSLKELLSLFEHFTQHNIKVEIAPEFVRKNEVWRLTGDATKLKKLVGDVVPAIPIEQSIQRIITAQEASLR